MCTEAAHWLEILDFSGKFESPHYAIEVGSTMIQGNFHHHG